MEFKILNPHDDSGFLQTIEFNFEEIKTELTERLEKYQNLVFTEETVKEAKDTKAGLNKFREAIETRRKEIKKLCLKPYEDFEIKVKELTKLIDEPIGAIDTQLKTFEESRIAKKLEEIKESYNGIFDGYTEIVPLDKIFIDQWKNATYKMNKIRVELQTMFDQITGELKTLDEMKLPKEIELQVKNVYLQSFNFGLAIQEKNRLEELQQRIEEHEKLVTYKNSPSIEEEKQQVNTPLGVEFTKIYERKFWVKGSKEQLISLGNYMKENNILYGGF